MKRITIFLAIAVTGLLLFSACSNKRSPGLVYMPDMGYSRTYEAYARLDSQKFTMDKTNKGGLRIFFNAMPPDGTIKRDELFPYSLPNDTVGYRMSAEVPNPLPELTAPQMTEARRLFNVNCAVCHGAKGTANGPLSAKIGAIANFTLDLYKTMKDGTMFHSITYGRNNMGSYASQLSRKQRWMMVKYIRTLQGGTGAATTDSTGTATPKDSAAAATTAP